MALSEQEQRMLREIEMQLMAEDPHFGASPTVRAPGSFFKGAALIMLGLTLLVGGMALYMAQEQLYMLLVSVVGFLVMFGAGIWMVRGGKHTEPTQTSTPNIARIDRSAKGNGFGSRMEENFRKRFEQ